MAKYDEIIDTNVDFNSIYVVKNIGYISESGVKLIRPIGKNTKKQLIWECECPFCNSLFNDLPARIKNGHTKSCGCLKTFNKKFDASLIKYSFMDWCKDNNHEDYLNLWDYKMNNISPDKVSYKSSDKFYFKCAIHKEHYSESRSLSHLVYNESKENRRGMICNQCDSFAQYGIDNYGKDFLEKYWDYILNKVDPWKIKKKCGTKVWIKCQEKDYHGSYYIQCDKFNGDKCRCPYCKKNSGKVHSKDSLGAVYPYVLNIWSDKNEKSPFEYAPHTNKKVWFKCTEGHDDYIQAINDATERGFICPECTRELGCSKLQKKVKDYIIEKYPEYTLLHEYNCTDIPKNPKTNYYLPFDNEIKELKLIIEVHGVQHYRISFFTKLDAEKYNITPEESLQKQQWRDEYKRNYITNRGYNYLIIPYWDETNENYMKLIDRKIKEILHNKTI